MFLPKGSWDHSVAPQFFNENGGLAITTSNLDNKSPSWNAGFLNVSPLIIWKSSTPCKNKLIPQPKSLNAELNTFDKCIDYIISKKINIVIVDHKKEWV